MRPPRLGEFIQRRPVALLSLPACFAFFVFLQAFDPIGLRIVGTLLIDPGPAGDASYRVDPNETRDAYFQTLASFAQGLPPSVSSGFSLAIAHYRDIQRQKDSKSDRGSMVSTRKLWQTDKAMLDESKRARESWIDTNPNWEYGFLDDAGVNAFVNDTFGGSDISWAFDYMKRGVLRADFFRYLILLTKGGVYSDVDTHCLQPIERWGTSNTEYYPLEGYDYSTAPEVVVGIDVDVHRLVLWHRIWPRPLGICQWTLSSVPSHPIFLDAARRVVDSTRAVEKWEDDRAETIRNLEREKPRGWRHEVKKLLKMKTTPDAISVMEWTGPGLFTDAVMAYLYHQFDGFSWRDLRFRKRPLRIGEVLILPVTGFSPVGDRDVDAEGVDSPQACVFHDFRGSWKHQGFGNS